MEIWTPPVPKTPSTGTEKPHTMSTSGAVPILKRSRK